MKSQSQAGSQEVEVLVEDSQGAQVRQRYTVVVSQTAANLPPAITSTPAFAASVGEVYQYQVTATDPDGEVPQYQLLEKPDASMTLDPVTGWLQWTPTAAGEYSVTVGAVDASGAGAAQQFTITAAVNQAPQITSIPVQSMALGTTYRYDVKATDGNNDRLTYALTAAPNGMEIDALGRIRWQPTAAGSYAVEVAVTDSRGATVTQPYTLNVAADQTAPKVSLWSSHAGTVDQGTAVTYVVSATDNVAVESLQLTVNGTPVALDATGRATVTMSAVGNVQAVAQAFDAAGNAGTDTEALLVRDASDTEAPVVELTGPEDEATITTLSDITGTVSDTNLLSYQLEVAPVAGGEFVEIASGTTTVNNGVLGQFDPSVLGNDSYILRLTATDAGGNVASTEQVVNVVGDLKLGNFQLSFTDLSVPVAGIPINVTRTYDTLNANTTDDFGYGWRLEFRDTDLRTSLKPDPVYQELGVRTVGFKEGTKVFVTLPGGKRETFTFKPILNPEIEQLLKNGAFIPPALWFYNPAFVSEKGVTSTLSVNKVQLSRNANTGEYSVVGTPYHPADATFGGTYSLTTKEGMVYQIDGTSGDLLTATDTNGNKLTFTDGGIFSDSGKQVTFERDARGRITSVTDPLGNQIRYEYDAFGDLIKVTDREENGTEFIYDEPERQHFLTQIIDPLGRTGVRNEYDEKGRLKKLFDANGEAVELIHDPNNFVETVKDVFGKPTTYEYDSRGNIVTEIDPLGKVTKRTYSEDNYVLTETVITPESGPNGWTTEYTYDTAGNKLTEKDPLGNITRYTYGEFGRLLTETDPLGNTTTNTYSKSGNLLSSKDAAGNVTEYSYDLKGNLLSFTDANKKVTQFRYDPFGNVASVLDALNNETTYTYDANGNRKSETQKVTTPLGIQSLVTKWDYDNSGKLKFVTDAENKVTEYQYDKNGNQIAVIDALFRKTESRYDDKGQLIETIYPDNTPNNNADNPRTINLYDKGGRKRATIDQDGRVTHYKYDEAGQLIETIYPKATDTLSGLIAAIAPNQTPSSIDWTEVVYPDETPNYLATNPRSRTEYYKTGEVKAQIDERGNQTEYRYNERRELIETIYPDNTPNTLADNPRTRSEYDKLGRKVADVDQLGQVTRYEYDSLGRLIKTIYPDSTPNNLSDNPTTRTEYDKLGRKVADIDQAGQITRYEYDANGQLTDVVQTLNSSGTAPTEVRTEYGYDEAGRLVWIEDALDRRTEYEYDKNGRRIVTELPLSQRSYTTYDAVGNIYTTTDFNGDTISYQYDAQNRLIKKEFSSASGQVPVSFFYNPTGLVERIVDARGTTTFKYDERHRLIARTDPNGPYLASGNTIEYGYDLAGNRTEVRTPNGTVTYTYDEQNRLKTVTVPNEGTTTYFYDAVGNLQRTELPNGVVETRDYDELNRLKFIKYSQDEAIISSFDYTLDLVGHRRVVQEQNGRKVEYEYDSFYRLTKETITDAVALNRTIEYSYDAVGNRLSKNDSVEGITTYTYDNNDRLKTEQLTKNGAVVHTIEYRYDKNGNLRSQIKNGVEEVSYTWDKENRLVGVTKANGEVISYQYDSEGIKVSSTVNGVRTEYLVDKNLPYAQVLEERVNNGLVAGYVYGLDLISQQRGSEKSFYLVDGLGSTRGLTDTSGVVTDSYAYDAFGNLIGSGGNTENNYLFAGEQFDESLGDYYLRARYYDSDTGRFTRRDDYEGKLGKPVTLHKYLYSNNNPTNYIDPSGNFSIFDATVTSTIITTLASIVATQALLPDPVQTPTHPGDITESSPYKIFFEAAVAAGTSVVASKVLATVFSSAIDDVVLTLPSSVGAQAAPVTITSAIKHNPYAIKLANGLKGTPAQNDVDSLVAQILKGNLNPGLGTKHIKGSYFEFRGRNAGRIIAKQISSTRYEIVGKFQGHARGDAENSKIIYKLIEDYEKYVQ